MVEPKNPLVGTTKFSNLDLSEERKRIIFPTPKRVFKKKIFNLYSSDLDNLNALVKSLNSESNRIVTAADVIRGLLLIGSKINPKNLMNAIKDANN